MAEAVRGVAETEEANDAGGEVGWMAIILGAVPVRTWERSSSKVRSLT